MVNLRKLVVFIWVAVFFSACAAPKAPEVKQIEDIKVVSMTNKLITVEANVVLVNPNLIDLEITGADIDVTVNDMEAAKINKLTNTKIEGNTEKKVPLTVSFPPNKVIKLDNLGDLFNIVAKKKAKVAYKGKINVKAVGISFDVAVEKEQEVKLK